jgi:hypothetical protein
VRGSIPTVVATVTTPSFSLDKAVSKQSIVTRHQRTHPKDHSRKREAPRLVTQRPGIKQSPEKVAWSIVLTGTFKNPDAIS